MQTLQQSQSDVLVQVQELYNGALFHIIKASTKEEIDKAKESGRKDPPEKWEIQESFGKMTLRLVRVPTGRSKQG